MGSTRLSVRATRAEMYVMSGEGGVASSTREAADRGDSERARKAGQIRT